MSSRVRRFKKENVCDNHVSTIFKKRCVRFSQYNSDNCDPPFVPGGSAMQILVPWKPVVIVWGLLSAMIFLGFVASSVFQGKDPFAPGAIIAQPRAVKAGATQGRQQQAKHSKAARTPNQ